MSMIKDIKTYLISQGVTTPIFLGHIPEGETQCIGLYRYAGKTKLKEAGIERCGLQARCRAANYEDAYDTAKLICTLLNGIGDDEIDGDAVVIDGVKYFRVYSVSKHTVNRNDGYVETAENYIVNKE
jgi:hypothetical protein